MISLLRKCHLWENGQVEDYTICTELEKLGSEREEGFENMGWEYDVWIRILCVEVTETQPKSAKARKGKLLEVYQRCTKSFGSWRTRLGKWTRMKVVPVSLKQEAQGSSSQICMVRTPLRMPPVLKGTIITAEHVTATSSAKSKSILTISQSTHDTLRLDQTQAGASAGLSLLHMAMSDCLQGQSRSVSHGFQRGRWWATAPQ